MRLKATVKVYFTKAIKSDVIIVRYPPSLLTIADTSVIIFFFACRVILVKAWRCKISKQIKVLKLARLNSQEKTIGMMKFLNMFYPSVSIISTPHHGTKI